MNASTQYDLAIPEDNVQWDAEYNNVPHFASKAALLTFLKLTDDDFGAKPSLTGVNLAFVTESETMPVNVDLDDFANVTASRATQWNYLVAKETRESGDPNYLFFFVTGSKMINYHTIQLMLRLDLFQTYMVNIDWKMSGTALKRAHRDRFTASSAWAEARFNLSASSPANHSDEYAADSAPMYPAKNLSLGDLFPIDPNNGAFADHIKGWICLWYNAIDAEEYGNIVFGQNAHGFDFRLPLVCVFAPIMEEGWRLRVSVDGTILRISLNGADEIDWFARDMAFSGNREMQMAWQDTSHFKKLPLVSITFCRYCPAGYMGSMTVDETNKLITLQAQTLTADGNFHRINYSSGMVRTQLGTDYTANAWAPIIQRQQDALVKAEKALDLTALGITTKFDLSKIGENAVRSKSLEPKLIGEPFLKITLNNYQTTQNFTLTPFDLEDSSFYYTSFDMIYPTGTFEFATFTPAVSDTVITDFFKMMKGLTFSSIYVLPKVDDTYLDYLRNNKNAVFTGFLQPALDVVSGAASGALAGAVVGRGVGAVIGGAIGATAAAITRQVSYAVKIDDMKNSTKQMSQLATNPLVSFFGTSRLFDYFEVWRVNPAVEQSVYEMFFKYGYEVDQIIDSTDWFGRSRFNFVQAAIACEGFFTTLDGKGASIASENKTTMSDALMRGITFWEPASFGNYSLENWEKRLLPNG